MEEQTSQNEEATDNEEPENAPYPGKKAQVICEILWCYSEYFVQIPIPIKDHRIVVPGLSGPEPDQPGPRINVPMMISRIHIKKPQLNMFTAKRLCFSV